MYSDFTSTPIFNQPMLRYPATGTLAPLQIPLHITTYKMPQRQAKINVVNVIPQLGGGNIGYKSSLIQSSGVELSLISIQGWIQTPFTITGTTAVLALTYTENGVTSNVTFAERMVAYMEGRASNTAIWSKVDPDWFRDPYGRVYTSPKVTNLTGSYIETVPGRTNFSLTLQV